MEPLAIKILLACAGSIFMAMLAGIKYMITKLKEIVPEAQIKEMIKEGTVATDLRTAMVFERLARIEQQLDNVMDILIDHGRKTHRKK